MKTLTAAPDVWSLHLDLEPEHVTPSCASTFLLYLFSPSTKKVEVRVAIHNQFVDVSIVGKMCLDIGPHTLSYRLTKGEVSELSTADKALLVRGFGAHLKDSQMRQLRVALNLRVV
jgi:hypothetical protein